MPTLPGLGTPEICSFGKESGCSTLVAMLREGLRKLAAAKRAGRTECFNAGLRKAIEVTKWSDLGES